MLSIELYRLIRYVWTHPLNAEAKFTGIGRLVKWQIGSRLLPGIVELPYVDTTSLFVKRGMTGATGNWYGGLHEVNEMAFLLHLLRPSDHFLDVGANIGSYTILAAGAVGTRATAVEPIPSTFKNLRRNVALNGLDASVRCWQGGLSECQSTLRFTSDLDSVNHVLADHESVSSIEVPVTTVDLLVGHDIPSLIKIDVEGHEAAVLKGASKVLSDPRLLAVIMEINGSGERYGSNDDDLYKVMCSYGFRPNGYDPFGRKLLKERTAGDNAIFVRDPAAVQERISAARTYSLVNRSI